MTDREVKVRFTGDARQLEQTTDSLGSKVSSLAKGLLAFGGGLALGGLFKKAVQEGLEAEQVMDRLRKTVTNAGTSFAQFAPQAEEVIDKLQRTTRATDDGLRAALTRLIGITQDTTGSLKNLSLVNDLAAFSGRGLEESAVIVGKAMMGNTKALKEFGISAKDSTNPIEELRAKVIGLAEAQSQGLGGALAQIKKQFSEVLEAIGTVIIGSENLTTGSNALATSLANFATWIAQNEDGIRNFGNLLVTIGSSLGTIFRNQEEELKNTGGIWRAFARGEWAEFRRLYLAELGHTEKVVQTSAKKQTGFWELAARKQVDFQKDVTDEEAKELAKREDERRTHEAKVVLLNQESKNLILAAQSKLNDNLKEQGLTWQQIKKKADEHAVSLRDLLERYQKPIEESLKENEATLTEIAEQDKERTAEAKDQKDLFRDHVASARNMAGGLIDAAQAMGSLSTEAASALNSIVNMGASLAAVTGGDLTGLAGIIGSLANIIGQWGSNPAEKLRRDILNKNTASIERLTREFGDFNLGITGRAFAAAEDVFGGTLAQVAELERSRFRTGELSTRSREGVGQLRQSVLKQLTAKGISVESLTNIGGDLGELFRQFFETKDPELLIKLFPQIVKALGSTELGAASSSFEDQLQALEESFGVFGVEDADVKLAGFKRLAGKFSPALAKALEVDLSTPAGVQQAIANLQGLFTKLLAGELTPEEIGVSGPQFRALINTMLGLLRGADTVSPPTVAPPTSPTVPTGGTGSVGVTTPNVGTLPVLGGIGIDTTVTPVTIGTQIQGDVNNTFHVVPRPQDDLEELAELVAQAINRSLGRSNTAKLVATGTPVHTGGVV